MSFVWKADRPLRSEEQVAREVHEVSLARGLDEFASVLALMCIRQESTFWCPWNRKDPSSEKYAHDSESDDGRSVAYFQQQNGRAGEALPAGDRENWWGDLDTKLDLKRACTRSSSGERRLRRRWGTVPCSVIIDKFKAPMNCDPAPGLGKIDSVGVQRT